MGRRAGGRGRSLGEARCGSQRKPSEVEIWPTGSGALTLPDGWLVSQGLWRHSGGMRTVGQARAGRAGTETENADERSRRLEHEVPRIKAALESVTAGRVVPLEALDAWMKAWAQTASCRRRARSVERGCFVASVLLTRRRKA